MKDPETEKKEKKIIDKLIKCLADQHLYLAKDYKIEEYHAGCFIIRFCPNKLMMLNIQYIYDIMQNIIIFKIQHSKNTLKMHIKIRR